VIGANSVVTADVEPFSIAAGAPARVLRRIAYEKR
jgi:acetyltransferase-like isoleucine patch superfamily enzyme